MTIVGVTMVKDEADILEATIRHTFDQDVDVILCADNGSTDATSQILEGLVAEYGDRLRVFEDPEPGYYQADKINALAEIAAQDHDAEWVVPFDADEFWHSSFGDYAGKLGTVGEVLRHPHVGGDADVLYAVMLDQRTLTLRRPDPKPLPKVAYRYVPGARVEMGNHEVTLPLDPVPGGVRSGRRIAGALALREFQYRSFPQFVRKVRNGAAAYAATDLPPTYGAHWRELGALDDDELWRRWCDRSKEPTVVDPIPFPWPERTVT